MIQVIFVKHFDEILSHYIDEHQEGLLRKLNFHVIYLLLK